MSYERGYNHCPEWRSIGLANAGVLAAFGVLREHRGHDALKTGGCKPTMPRSRAIQLYANLPVGIRTCAHEAEQTARILEGRGGRACTSFPWLPLQSHEAHGPRSFAFVGLLALLELVLLQVQLEGALLGVALLAEERHLRSGPPPKQAQPNSEVRHRATLRGPGPTRRAAT